MWFSLFHTLSSDVSSPGTACRFRFVGVAAFSSPCNRRSVHPRLLSSLSHTTPLRCPAFSSSPPLYLHVVEPTEGPNTQTRQGLASTSTALVSRWRCKTAVRVTAEAGGQDAANHLNFSKRNESADNAPDACVCRYAIAVVAMLAMAACESLLVA